MPLSGAVPRTFNATSCIPGDSPHNLVDIIPLCPSPLSLINNSLSLKLKVVCGNLLTVFALVMVGLPARGKTYMARKLCRYLSWLGYSAATFNVGNYRRFQCGSHVDESFFDPFNVEGVSQRKKAAEAALIALSSWLNEEDPTGMKELLSIVSLYSNPDDLSFILTESICKVAIYDATNSTKERRTWIINHLLQSKTINSPSQVFFIESICNDARIVNSNILQVKLSSPDYKNQVDPEKAKQDFIQRINHYEQAYEPLNEHEWLLSGFSPKPAIMKVINVGKEIRLFSCNQYWQTRIASYLMNLHITPRCIYLCRHGESDYNVKGIIGGDSSLSPNGEKFAQRLPEWLKEHFHANDHLTVPGATIFIRCTETAKYLPYPKIAWKALDEIHAGTCDGLRYDEIQSKFEGEYSARLKNKFFYRYPNGESYSDLVLRLEPIIIELERQKNILVIGHQAVLRAIVAYFTGIKQEDIPYVEIPLHVILELRPLAYGCEVVQHLIDIPAVNTHIDRKA